MGHFKFKEEGTAKKMKHNAGGVALLLLAGVAGWMAIRVVRGYLLAAKNAQG